jgi:hypothetical protein
MTLSGCRELNPVYLLPKQAYYRYTTSRQHHRLQGARTFRHYHDPKHLQNSTGKLPLSNQFLTKNPHMLQVKTLVLFLFFTNTEKGDIPMGAGPKIFLLPLQKPRKKSSPLKKLQEWRKKNIGFIRAKHPITQKVGFWEIDNRGWSLEYTLFVGEIDTQEKSVQLLNFRREIVGKISYTDIEIISGTLFLRET